MYKSETGYKLINLDSVDSTNNYAKALGDVSQAVVIAAETQTGGRGRLGRSFISPAGVGIYMSIVIPRSEIKIPLFLVTPAAAVATCRAIKNVCGVSPQIKWVNDIYLNNKKICGILTEVQSGTAESIIVGIGVNCFPGSFPIDVAEIAGCISDDRFSFDREQLLKEIANSVLAILSVTNAVEETSRVELSNPSTNEESSSEPAFLSEYRKLCFILGKQVVVMSIPSGEKYNATAIDIDCDGALIVKRTNDLGESEVVRLISADVSVHLD